MTYKLSIPIDEAGYSYKERSNYDYRATKGGLSRSRLLFDRGAIDLSMQCTMTESEYNESVNFYKVGANWGKVPFLIDLVIDNALLSEQTANFVTGPSINKVQGLNYTVVTQLEVAAPAANDLFDTSICAVFEAAYPAKPDTYLNLFNQIVNVNWPA